MAALGFIPATKQDAFTIGPDRSMTKVSCNLSGQEARQFYEDLMKDNKAQGAARTNKMIKDRARRVRERERRARAGQEHAVQRGSSGGNDGNQRREVTLSERTMELLGLRLLRCAHEGDISGVKELLSKGVDINFQVQCSVLFSFKR